MILVADELTSDSSRALEQSMRANKSNFAVRNIASLISNDKYLVSDKKIPFKNSSLFNDHNIYNSTKTKIKDRCDGTNKITTRE